MPPDPLGKLCSHLQHLLVPQTVTPPSKILAAGMKGGNQLEKVGDLDKDTANFLQSRTRLWYREEGADPRDDRSSYSEGDKFVDSSRPPPYAWYRLKESDCEGQTAHPWEEKYNTPPPSNDHRLTPNRVNDLLAGAPLPAYLGRMPTWSRQRR
ncbi:hypothetical protein Bbelb_399410 [Branchiostoma belcheri]|nr:hypothetical protein Bbelb_399410 [Branchiostoma belcheri]